MKAVLPDTIVATLRQVEVLTSQRQSVAEAISIDHKRNLAAVLCVLSDFLILSGPSGYVRY